MDTFFGFHIGKGIARNVNIENGPPIGARFLDPKTGPPFGEIVRAFAAAFLRLTRAGFVWMWNSLQVYISDMAHGSLPSYLSTARQHMQLWGDASRTRPWGWFWNPFLGTGNNIVLRFFGRLIFAQAARSIGGQWLLPWASAVWLRQS